jgi:hypothetical protein
LTWLEVSFAKLGAGALARAVEVAAQAAPVIMVTPSADAPSSEAALRRVKDILRPPSRKGVDHRLIVAYDSGSAE